VAEKARGFSGQATAREFESPELAPALSVPQGNPLQSIATVVKLTQKLYAAYPNMVKGADAALAQMGHSDGVARTQGEVAAYPWTPALLAGIADKRNGNQMVSDVLPGGAQLAFFLSDQPATSEAQMDTEAVDMSSQKKLPVLTPQQAVTIANQVGELARQITQVKSEMGKAIETGKKLAALAKSFATAQVGDDQKAEMEVKRQTVLAIKKALDEPFKAFNVYAIRTGNAALNWVEKSGATYGTIASAKPAAPNAEAPAKA
jgi:hypothetical protein